MSDLIKRLENATGPDLGLNMDIPPALGFAWNGKLTTENPLGRWERPDGTMLADSDFTGSLEAAVTLVRVLGFYWLASEGRTRPDEPLGGVQLRQHGTLMIVAECEHESVAIALCIAALDAAAPEGK